MRLFRPWNPSVSTGVISGAAGCIDLRKKRSFFALFLALCLLLCPCTALADTLGEISEADLQVDCGSCLLADMDSGTVLYGQDNDQRIYPASVTKVLTALVVLRHIDQGDLSLYDTVTVSKTFREGLTYQAAVADLSTGEQVDIEQLLYMLLLPSACDAANVLAEAASGSVADFAEEMNDTAEELGCTDSHFVNPSGLHSDDHYTTCNDLFLIGKAAYGYETFRNIVGSKSHTVPATNNHGERLLHNTNALISSHNHSEYLYEPCKGGKTGSTNPAGFCLLSYAEQDNLRLCCVMMGCDWHYDANWNKIWPQYYESVRLYKWGFEHYERRTVVEKGSEQGSVPVSDAREGKDATVGLRAKKAIKAIVGKDVKEADLKFTAQLPEEVIAPVKEGDKLGTLTVALDGRTLGTTDLLAVADVEKRPRILDRLGGFAHHPRGVSPVGIVLGLVGLVLLFFLVQALRRRAWRRRRARERAQRRRRAKRSEWNRFSGKNGEDGTNDE